MVTGPILAHHGGNVRSKKSLFTCELQEARTKRATEVLKLPSVSIPQQGPPSHYLLPSSKYHRPFLHCVGSWRTFWTQTTRALSKALSELAIFGELLSVEGRGKGNPTPD